MADSAGELTFTFGADFSRFTREVDSAGARLDALARTAGNWPAAIGRAGGDDSQAGRVVARLGDRLALLRSTGAEHDAILTRMRVEAEQTRLGTDATAAQKNAVAGLVVQIEAAGTAQAALAQRQQSVNQAWGFGSDALERGLEGLILRGQRLGDVVRSTLSSFAAQGLRGALTGGGAFGGLFGTSGRDGAAGGLFGAVQALFGGGAGGGSPSFAGLFAGGGTVPAGQWGIVGEKGAEIVSGPASVTPVGALPRSRGAAAHQTITVNVTTPDAPSFARSEHQVTAMLARAVGRGGRNA